MIVKAHLCSWCGYIIYNAKTSCDGMICPECNNGFLNDGFFCTTCERWAGYDGMKSNHPSWSRYLIKMVGIDYTQYAHCPCCHDNWKSSREN